MNSHSERETTGCCSLRNPHFFKIILDDAIQNGKLMIPTNFVSKYGTDHLKKSVVLQVPDGRAWNVGLSKCNEEVWLRQGLHEFMEYYSIECGQFMTFRYEANTTLSVTIFDRSATEIDYPYTSSKTEEYTGSDQDIEFMSENIAYPKRKDKSPVEYPYTSSKTVYTESEDNESLGENKAYPKRKDKSPPVSSSQPHKLRTYSTVKTEISSEDTEFSRERLIGKINPTAEIGKKRTSAGLSNPERKKMQSVKQQLIESEKKAKCILRASSFTSNNPFFTVSMRPSYVRRLSRTTGMLYIRKLFAQKHLLDKEGTAYASLHYSDRTWAVMYRREASSSVLSGGWSAFVKDNNLKVDDVCVFELLEGPGISLNVYIFRLDELEICRESANYGKPEKSPGIHIKSEINDDNGENVPEMISSSSTLNHEEKAIAAEKASDFKSQNPFFVIVMQPSYIDGRSRLNVPPRFFKQYLNGNHCKASFTVSGEKTWTFPLLIDRPDDGRRRPSFRFSNKWREFAKENNLKVLDVCVFEVIDGLRNSFRVSISPSGDSQHREVADKFTSEYPVHKFIMAPSHYSGVTVPWSFVVKLTEQTVENDVKVLHLQFGEKSWPVKFHSYPEHRNGKIHWLGFARENSLQFGDVCVFQLINQDDAVVKKLIVLDRRNIPPFHIRSDISEGNAHSVPAGNVKILRTCLFNFSNNTLTRSIVKLLLTVLDGRTWTLPLLTRGGRASISGKSWEEFSMENNLKVGDVCVFELTDRLQSSFRVVIMPLVDPQEV